MKQFKILLLAMLTVFFTACGGGGSGGDAPTAVTGSFVDDPVQGLNYICSPSGKTGITNASGEFTCGLGSDVTFMIGDLVLGTASAKSGFVTPYDLFPNNEEAAINVARILQTLDSDPSDDIITFDNNLIERLPSDIDFESFSENEVEAALGIPLVDKQTAQETMDTAYSYTYWSYPDLNKAPTANAGSDKTVEVEQAVTITGSGTDTDGTIVSNEWTKDGNVIATTASFDYVPTVVGTDTLTLTVTDDDGATASDSMQVTVTATPDTIPPVITVLGNNPETVIVGESYADAGATAVDDEDGEVVVITTGSVNTSTAGTYTLTYTATDSSNNSTTTTRTAIVEEMPVSNTQPVANAGTNQIVTEGETVNLNGSQSYDPDGDDITFSWSFQSKPNGSSAVINNSTSLNPYFMPDLSGEYTVQLIVNDGKANSSPNAVVITVNEIPNQAPTAEAGENQEVEEGANVILDASGSSDSDGSIVSYVWKEGGTTLSTASNFTKTDFTVGTHTITLTVTDDDGVSDTDTVVVIVNKPDVTPDILNLNFEITQVDGEAPEISIDLLTNSSDFGVQVLYWLVGNNQTWVSLQNIGNNEYSYTSYLNQNASSGTYEIRRIDIHTADGVVEFPDTLLESKGFNIQYDFTNSTPDNDAPELRNFTITGPLFDESGNRYYVDYFLEAEDIGHSGLQQSAIVELQNSDGNSLQTRVYFDMNNQATGRYYFSEYARSGTYIVNTIRLYDNADNSHFYRPSELESLGFQSSVELSNPNEDVGYPVLEEFTLTFNNQTDGVNYSIELNFRSSDDKSGFGKAYVRYYDEDGNRYDSWIYSSPHITNIPESQLGKLFRVSYFKVYDVAGNISTYYETDLISNNFDHEIRLNKKL